MTISYGSDPSSEEIEALQLIQTAWNSGDQTRALELLRPRADSDAPWALGLMAWLYMQQGIPGFQPAIPWAKRAADAGVPSQALNLFNNIIANAPQAPQLVPAAVELLGPNFPANPGVDTIGQGWNLIMQGRPLEGLRLMNTTWHWPIRDSDWNALVERANTSVQDLRSSVGEAAALRDDLRLSSTQGLSAIEAAVETLQTRASQAGLLVTDTTSKAVNALYETEAKSNAKGSMLAWISGLIVLVAAAAVAIYPLLQHYRDAGPDYSGTSLIGVHLAATGALATIAGVLLARSRTRDLARQQARALSTAMGTMLTYSGQIKDEDERERFMLTMGQLVLQAHLNQSSAGEGGREALTGTAALLTALRDPRGPTSSSQTTP